MINSLTLEIGAPYNRVYVSITLANVTLLQSFLSGEGHRR